MASDIAISVNNLSKCYQIYAKPVDRLKQSLWRGRKTFFTEFWAMNNVSFNVKKGETLGIIGANGSGKSTLLQLICGILNPTSGDLTVKGRVAALLELGAGFNPEFSGRDNVLMNAAVMGLGKQEIDACYDDILSFSGIGEFIERPVKTYSSGMYVRLAFATAIHVSPDILVVDEALSVGDIRFQQKCMARIRQFCETGTVVFVSHDMSALTELCSRAIWLEGGEIRIDGKPKEVIEKYVEFMYRDTAKNMSVSTAEASHKDCADEPAEEDSLAGFLPVPPDAHQFGNQSVRIEKVRLMSDKAGNGIVYSGKSCKISVLLECRQEIEHPIFGFFVKDRLGREIIGDNTDLMGQQLSPLKAGHQYLLDTSIKSWPNIQQGDYTLSVAIADGTMEEHVQCHLLHDAVPFQSIPARIPGALFSVLDTSVHVSKLEK